MIRLVAGLSFLMIPLIVLGQNIPVVTRGMPARPNAYPYGNILFPGGTPPPHMNTHAGRMGPAVSGSIPYTGVPPGQIGRPGRPRTVVVPYAYPVFYGGGYYQEPQSTNVTVVVPQQPVPSVIINNNYVPPEPGKPALREYSAGELPQSGVKVYEGGGSPQPRQESAPATGRSIMDEKPTIHLIALKDGTIRQALGYWVRGEELHYVTPDSTLNHVSLATVDRERSVELNAERKIDFDLRLSR